jgi:hypothetical protein
MNNVGSNLVVITEEAGENKPCLSELNHANARATYLDRRSHTLSPSMCLFLQALTILVVNLLGV